MLRGAQKIIFYSLEKESWKTSNVFDRQSRKAIHRIYEFTIQSGQTNEIRIANVRHVKYGTTRILIEATSLVYGFIDGLNRISWAEKKNNNNKIGPRSKSNARRTHILNGK